MSVSGLIQAVNWNKIEDPKDKEVWDRLIGNFWTPEKVPVANDLPQWIRMRKEEKLLVSRVFGGLTLLDTLQYKYGAPLLIPSHRTLHEAAVYDNIAFMEAIHAKSYSSIYSTLLDSEEINNIFDWVHTNELLQKKAKMILTYYYGEDSQKRKIASVMLESFLFYSGFYTPLYYVSHQLLTNTADIIKLIIRDEAVHGYYIGYKYQVNNREASQERKEELESFTYELLHDLYEIEEDYTHLLYDAVGLTEDVLGFLKYNANKALMNLGYNALYQPEEIKVNPAILAAMAPDSENHDFFSGVGSTYVVGEIEDTEDEDWDF